MNQVIINQDGYQGTFFWLPLKIRTTVMRELLCIKCHHAVFLDPKKEICYKTGGLFCKKLKTVVGKYDACRLTKPMATQKKKRG